MRTFGIGGGIGTIILVLIGLFFGIDPSTVLQIGNVISAPQQSAPQPSRNPAPSSVQDQGGKFVSYVLADTEATWGKIFQQAGGNYPAPKLVMFNGRVASACGMASTASGPFYCPGDQKVYIDLAFYEQLKRQFKAPGDFAQAYVVAHEIGHHVQNVIGTMDKVDAMRRRGSEAQSNALSVRLELQADCYAGVWAANANSARNIIEQGDIEEALNAAARIGDDNIQKMTQGYVVPDGFTHGTSEQRVRWFKTGLQSGNIKSCDTFTPRQP
jgi:predicted metalloprotease